jgi:hypothetical protein
MSPRQPEILPASVVDEQKQPCAFFFFFMRLLQHEIQPASATMIGSAGSAT